MTITYAELVEKIERLFPETTEATNDGTPVYLLQRVGGWSTTAEQLCQQLERRDRELAQLRAELRALRDEYDELAIVAESA